MGRDQSSYGAFRGIDKRMGDERVLSCFWQPKLDHYTPTRIDIHRLHANHFVRRITILVRRFKDRANDVEG
jgi:hypothetical protein